MTDPRLPCADAPSVDFVRVACRTLQMECHSHLAIHGDGLLCAACARKLGEALIREAERSGVA